MTHKLFVKYVCTFALILLILTACGGNDTAPTPAPVETRRARVPGTYTCLEGQILI